VNPLPIVGNMLFIDMMMADKVKSVLVVLKVPLLCKAGVVVHEKLDALISVVITRYYYGHIDVYVYALVNCRKYILFCDQPLKDKEEQGPNVILVCTLMLYA